MPRLVLVTGSSRGIGRSIALRLAEDGWRPLIYFHKQSDAAAEVARQSGGLVAPKGFDLSESNACLELWEWASSQGQVDALVNNSGVYQPLDFADADDDRFADNFRGQFESNFGSAVRMSRRFIQAAQPGSRILNVASRVGFKGEAGASAYAASKAALISLTRSLAVELACRGIGVFGIAPGWVETAMTREGMQERRAEIEASIPLSRVATPDDCAAAAAFLLRDESQYLSGHIIDVNGASYFH
jgi:3-oxoacyl-[acyl-carrier protein] reductase